MNLRQIVIFVLTFFLFLPAAVQAQSKNDLFVDVTLLSKHIGIIPQPLNEINPGIGLSYFVSDNWELRGGAYYNSYKKTALYLVANYIPFSTDWKDFSFNFGVAAGFVTGYKDSGITILGKSPIFYGILPMIAPNIAVLYKPINTRAIFLLLGNAVGLQISYRL